MSATVVYESVYANTRAAAEAIAEGLGEAEVLAVHDASSRVEHSDLLIVGGPTPMHGMATSRSRQAAVEALHEDGNAHHIEPGATQEPGLRAWLRDLPGGPDRKAAAFDTRIDRSPWLTGAGSRGIASGFPTAGMTSSIARASWSRSPRGRSRKASSTARVGTHAGQPGAGRRDARRRPMKC